MATLRRLQGAALVLALALLTGCAWYPFARIPADKEGALIIRCHQYKGILRKESRWLIVIWVWSKSGNLPENPGNLEIEGECNWRVERAEAPEDAPDE